MVLSVIRTVSYSFKKCSTPSRCQIGASPFSDSADNIQYIDNSTQICDDAAFIPFVGNWSYWYRKNGMQTSTDDILVATVASSLFYGDDYISSLNTVLSADDSELFKLTQNVESPNVYVDLGCGIGSILLLVTHKLKPTISLGFEAQLQSASLAQLTIGQIVKNNPSFTSCKQQILIVHEDIRNLRLGSSRKLIGNGSKGITWQELLIIQGRCDLVTANPPYLPVTPDTKSVCADSQRRSARFAYRGGIEEYALTARELLAPQGQFVFSFWSRDIARVELAMNQAGLSISSRVDVIMGSMKSNQPHISIFVATIATKTNSPAPFSSHENIETEVLDLRFDGKNEATPKRYREMRRWLDVRPRPLKSKNKQNT